ncbi:MAG: hypothetical protein IPO18_08965 [bacterium]|nr:hypothetical protein [bacterium]
MPIWASPPVRQPGRGRDRTRSDDRRHAPRARDHGGRVPHHVRRIPLQELRDPSIKWLVDNRELYLIPVVNPDGFVYNETTDPNGGGMWRKNRSPQAGGPDRRRPEPGKPPQSLGLRRHRQQPDPRPTSPTAGLRPPASSRRRR